MPGIGIGAARRRFGRCLTETVEVLRKGADVDDGSGGWTAGGETVVATVPGRIVTRTVAPRDAVTGAEPATVLSWTVYLPWGTEVRPTDVLRRGSDRFEVDDADSVRTDGVAVVVAVRRRR